MSMSTHITHDAVGMDRRRSSRLQQRGGTQNSISDAPEESLLQNPLQKNVILDLYICVEECRHYIRSNLQPIYILHSFFQGQSSVSMSTVTEGLCI